MKVRTFIMYGCVFFSKPYLIQDYSILGLVLLKIGNLSSLNETFLFRRGKN